MIERTIYTFHANTFEHFSLSGQIKRDALGFEKNIERKISFLPSVGEENDEEKGHGRPVSTLLLPPHFPDTLTR